MEEQNSTTALREARKARKTAKAELRTAREKLKRIEKALATLEAEKRRVQKQHQENEAALQQLDEQLQKRRLEKDVIAEQVQRQNEMIDAIRGAEGRKDEQARAESRLTTLNIQLDHLQKKIDWLEIRIRETQEKQDEIDDRLQELDDKIKEKSEGKKSAKKKVESKKEDLYRKRVAVADEVRAVKAKVVVDPLTHLRAWIRELNGLLQAFGAAGLFYAYTLMAGLVHEWWFYSFNGLRVTDYTILFDFLLILPVLSGVISTIAIILLGRGILLVPKISEYVALGLCAPLVALPVLRRFVIGLGVVGLSLMGPIVVGYCKYNVEKPCETCRILRDIDPGSRTPVTVLTDPPLRKAGDLVLVGSNSNYMFFKSSSKAGDDSSGVKAVPLTRIVCVGKDGCEAMATEPSGYSDYIAERLLPQFISEQMRCEEGTRLIISDFIRFVNDEPRSRRPVCPADALSAVGSGDGNAEQNALDVFYREKIRPKVQKIVDDFSKESPTRWTVFGFASPDGEERENACLSKNRAQLVIDEMCPPQGKGTSEPVTDSSEKRKKRCADTQVLYFGERHPINGISNSRSAVIAACVPKANG